MSAQPSFWVSLYAEIKLIKTISTPIILIVSCYPHEKGFSPLAQASDIWGVICHELYLLLMSKDQNSNNHLMLSDMRENIIEF